MKPDAKIKLPDVPRSLREAGFESPTYRSIYLRALDGAIPAERGLNGRWSVNRSDLSAIAEALNLLTLEQAAA